MTEGLGPIVVAHADWGTDARKRWLASAKLDARGRYRANAPQPVGDARTLLQRLRTEAGERGTAFVGFDFPIGLPATYARLVGIDDFKEALPRFGSGAWSSFYDVAALPSEISPRRPFYPARPGGTCQTHLISALGVATIDELRRQCERAHPQRRAACPLFWTLGGNQVGKGAIAGWRDVLGPALRTPGLDVALWPFDGALHDLFQRQRVVVAETYPAECYRHLGLDLARGASIGRSGKRSPVSRKANAEALLAWANTAGVALEPSLVAAINDGFGAQPDGEDRFDAVVGLFGMLSVVLGRQPAGEPEDRTIRRVEGWILGQTPTVRSTALARRAP